MNYEPRKEFGERDGKKTAKIKEQLGHVVGIFVIIAASIAFYFLLLRANGLPDVIGKLLNLMEPVLFGIVFAYILNPVMEFAERHTLPHLEKGGGDPDKAKKRARIAGLFAAYALTLIVIACLLGIVLPRLFETIRSLAFSLPAQLNRFVTYLTELVRNNSKLSAYSDVLTDALDQISSAAVSWLRGDFLKQINQYMSSITSGILNMVSVLLNLIIGLIVSVYLLYSKETFINQMKKLLYAIFKPENANLFLHIARKSNEIFSGFVIGNLIDSLIIGCLCFVAMSVLKMPYTLLVSVIVGVTNVIPFFGPFIGAIPSILLIMLANWKMGLYFLILIVVIQQMDGNVIKPKILGHSTGLSPFWVIVSILLGKGLFGFIGMLIGVPTFAVLYYIATMVVEKRLYQRKLPMDSVQYEDVRYIDGTTGEITRLTKEEPEDSGENNEKGE